MWATCLHSTQSEFQTKQKMRNKHIHHVTLRRCCHGCKSLVRGDEATLLCSLLSGQKDTDTQTQLAEKLKFLFPMNRLDLESIFFTAPLKASKAEQSIPAHKKSRRHIMKCSAKNSYISIDLSPLQPSSNTNTEAQNRDVHQPSKLFLLKWVQTPDTPISHSVQYCPTFCQLWRPIFIQSWKNIFSEQLAHHLTWLQAKLKKSKRQSVEFSKRQLSFTLHKHIFSNYW